MSDLTFSQMIESKVADYMASGKLDKVIEEKIDSCLDSVMNDAFSTYRGYGALVKEAVKEALPGNLEGVMDMAPYTHVVKKTLQSRLKVHFDASAQTLADNLIDELVATPPEEVKLSELMKEFAEYCTIFGNEKKAPYVKVTHRDSHILEGYWDVEFDEEKPAAYSQAEFKLEMDGDNRVIGFKMFRSGSDKNHPGLLGSFEKRIFQLAALRIPLILDDDFDPDGYFYEEDY